MDSLSETETEVDHDVSDERFPLLLEDHPNKASSRMENINRAVTKLLSRWPRHVTRSTLYYTSMFFIIFALFSLVAILTYAATAVFRNHTTWSRHALLVSLCDLSSGFITPRNTSDQEGSSLVGKLFYTLMDGDNFTSEEAGNVESTLKSNPNTTCYIMILSPPKTKIWKHTTEDKREINTLIEKYDNAILINVDGDNYFRASPLYDLWKHFTKNSTLIQFATRVLTLWQFGGTTYDSHILTLQKDSLSALPDLGDTVIMDLNHGLVMSAKQQCHAFLFEVVKVLAAVGKAAFSGLTTEHDVLSLALLSFCGKVQTTSNNGSVALELTCAGVTGLPPGLLCYTNQSDPGCMWGFLRHNASETAVQCPVTAMRSTT